MLVPAVLALLLPGCRERVTGNDDPPGRCTTSVEPALRVVVRDAATGEPAAAGARVTVSDGSYDADLEAVSPWEIIGPPERPGNYLVRVSRPGYAPVEFADVLVEEGVCHVLTVTLEADLVPAQDPPCVDDLIAAILSHPPYGASITRAAYRGEATYYVPQPCCDFLNPLYDSSCQVICHPDGGIHGQGDGQCADYHDERWDVQVIWEDPRQ
jgi:hypothetical protein